MCCGSEPNRTGTRPARFLNTVIQDIEKPLFGFRNEGLFALHALRQVEAVHIANGGNLRRTERVPCSRSAGRN